MFLPVLLALAPSAPAPTPQIVVPALPAMVGPEFQAQVLAVSRAMEKGDWTAAATLADALPKANFTMVWDDRKVDPETRAKLVQQRDFAIRAWRDALPGKTTFGPTGDVRISFDTVLAPDPETNAPAGVYVFQGLKKPRTEAVIALKRGAPIVFSQPTDVYNDVLLAVGSYLGVARNLGSGGAMTAARPGNADRHGLAFTERLAVRRNLEVAEALRKAIRERTPVSFQPSEAKVSPDRFEGDAVQGDHLELEVEIVNQGAGPLNYRIEGDCGCIVTQPPGTVPARGKTTIPVGLDTREFTTITTRNLRVYTNDPKEPVRVIPVSLNVKPKYRFLVPGGNARNIADGGTSFDVFLALAEGSEFGIRGAQLSGVQGEVKYEKWEGVLPDPERGEGETKRKGYRFRLKVPTTLPTGRSMVGLNISTDSLEFPSLSHTLTVQKGTVAVPEELFLGELGKTPKRATFVVLRPGTPLKILSATTDARSLKITILPGRNPNEAKIQVDYDGSAPNGEYSATVTLKLDDPKQPELLVPVTATVR
ncbi:MAG: hypothetical protein ACO1SV_00150 [Fimbriimonas sp.]